MYTAESSWSWDSDSDEARCVPSDAALTQFLEQLSLPRCQLPGHGDHDARDVIPPADALAPQPEPHAGGCPGGNRQVDPPAPESETATFPPRAAVSKSTSSSTSASSPGRAPRRDRWTSSTRVRPFPHECGVPAAQQRNLSLDFLEHLRMHKDPPASRTPLPTTSDSVEAHVLVCKPLHQLWCGLCKQLYRSPPVCPRNPQPDDTPHA